MVTDRNDAARLVLLLDAALAEADRQGNTLVAALVANCVEAAKRGLPETPPEA